MQVVYNANRLTKLVKEKKSKQNWLDYYQLKYTRNQARRPTMKVLLMALFFIGFTVFTLPVSYFWHFLIWQTGWLGLCGDRVDAIEYQTSEIERLSKEVIINPCIFFCSTGSFKTGWLQFYLFITYHRTKNINVIHFSIDYVIYNVAEI